MDRRLLGSVGPSTTKSGAEASTFDASDGCNSCSFRPQISAPYCFVSKSCAPSAPVPGASQEGRP